MSTRSTIIYSSNTGNHIWEETNEPVYYFDKFIGWNVYGEIDFIELKAATVKGGSIILSFIKGTTMHHLFPDGLELYGGSIIEFEMDSDSVTFGIKGDSGLVQKLKDAAKRLNDDDTSFYGRDIKDIIAESKDGQ